MRRNHGLRTLCKMLLVGMVPLMMGAKGCVGIPAHDYINTAYIAGQFYTFPGIDVPTSYCASDPFGLGDPLSLRTQLKLRLTEPLPKTVTAEPYGSTVTTVRGAAYETVLGTFPASFTVTGRDTETGKHFYAYAWTLDAWPEVPLSCLAAQHPCPHLAITADPTTGRVTIQSGWRDFNTGASCYTTWPDWIVSCHSDGSAEPDWWECYLPFSDLGGLPQ